MAATLCPINDFYDFVDTLNSGSRSQTFYDTFSPSCLYYFTTFVLQHFSYLSIVITFNFEVYSVFFFLCYFAFSPRCLYYFATFVLQHFSYLGSVITFYFVACSVIFFLHYLLCFLSSIFALILQLLPSATQYTSLQPLYVFMLIF